MWWYASRALAGSPRLMISGEGKRSGISVLGTESRVLVRPRYGYLDNLGIHPVSTHSGYQLPRRGGRNKGSRRTKSPHRENPIKTHRLPRALR